MFSTLDTCFQDNEVTLEEAGRILVPDSFEDTVFASLNPPVNPKSKN